MINGNSATLDSVRPVEIEGPLYEWGWLMARPSTAMLSGRWMIVGTLHDNATNGLTDVTDQHGRQDRLAQQKALPSDSTMNFPAQGEEAGQITVFTTRLVPIARSCIRISIN
ncbi:MAG: hypothetical protein HRU39_12435 [Salinicola sp.]|uniref:hypothetical protein n=1 Tax=Salinicola sp. TaxID=1978524 RepID=UPI001D30D599|nr:hypothetical protein [Salinicola sp.]NRB56771.1 hypothetical protein [Salinicola sp.]